jgi:16S rRNA G966 N2-methylase RsmD
VGLLEGRPIQASRKTRSCKAASGKERSPQKRLRLSQRVETRKTFIDLFAGCGGLSLGLMSSGWIGLFAVEKDRLAYETPSRAW